MLLSSAPTPLAVLYVAGGVALERRKTIGRVVDATSVALERSVADCRIVVAAGVAKERLITVGRVLQASSVVVESEKTGCRVVVARAIFEKGCCTDARISISSVRKEWPGTDTGVVATGGNALERIPTSCCIVDAGGEAQKGALPLCCVRRAIGGRAIASVRRWIDRLRCRQEPEAGKHDSNEEWQNGLFKISQCIHGYFFSFSRKLTLRLQV